MPTLAELARQEHRHCTALLEAATEDGDLAEAVAQAVVEGHALFLVADEPQAPLAEHLAAAIRRPFARDDWPPLVAVTPDPRRLALLGCAYSVARPLAQQLEMLVRLGDMALVLAGAQPTDDLLGAVELASSQGAIIAGLGLPGAAVEASPAVRIPEAPADQVAQCQLALGHALANALADRLPAEPPADMMPALLPFGCTNCGAALIVPSHFAGRRGVCPFCCNNTTLAPDQAAESNEHRTFVRFALRKCTLRVALTPPGKPPVPIPGQAILENLSRGGLLVALADSPVEIQPGDTLDLELTTPAFHKPVALQGTVHRVTREPGVHRIGVIFADLPPATAERLRILERNLVLRNLTAPPS